MGAIIAYRNFVDSATLSIGLGSAVAGFPVSNLKVRQLSTVGKITPAPFARLDCDLGAVKDRIQLIAFVGANSDPYGTPGPYPRDFRLTHSTDNATWSSGILSTTRMGLDLARMGLSPLSALVLQTPISARYLRLDLSWWMSSSSYSAGRLWVSDAVYLPEGTSDNWTVGAIDRGALDLSAGGQAVASVATKLRKLSVSLTKLNADLAFGYPLDGGGAAGDTASIQGMQMVAGNTGEVIVIPRTSDSVFVQRLGIYGHVLNEYPIRKLPGDNYAVDLTVVEER